MNIGELTKLDPSALSRVESELLRRMASGKITLMASGEDGKPVALPEGLIDLITAACKIVSSGAAVMMVSEHKTLTTQAAADFLGMSRQFLVDLVEQGEIPFHRVGSHRRVILRDLVVYREKRHAIASALLDQMTDEAVAAGVYDRWTDPTRYD